MSETRKLQRIGGNTLYVSLPKRWTSKIGLKQGDKVTLIPQLDGSISVYSTARQESQREIILEVRAEDLKQSIERGIIAAYVDGFDLIMLKTKEGLSEEQQKIIREAIENLFGLEVIEVTRNNITIQCLLKQTLPVEKTIQRIHSMILSIFTEAISALEERDFDLILGLTRRMHDIKRLSLVTHRLLRSMILFPRPTEQSRMNSMDCADYLQILHLITEIAANVNRVSETVITLSEHPFPEYILNPLCKKCVHLRDLYDQSIRALLSKDVQLANLALDSKLNLEDLWELCMEADDKSEISSLTLSNAYLLVYNLKQMQRYAKEIAEIAIDQAEARFER